MSRNQMKYWYVIDQARYHKYTPGQRFQHVKFKAWKIAAKRKAEDPPKEDDQPEKKAVKDAPETEPDTEPESKMITDPEPPATDDTKTLAEN